MKYDSDIFHIAGIEYQSVDPLSRQKTKGTYDADIGSDVPVAEVTTHPKRRQNKFVHTTPNKTLNDTNEPLILAINEFISAQSIGPSGNKVRLII